MTHRHLITDPATAATFLFAGKAIFTLANTETDRHATYRVEAVKGEKNVFEIALFTGTENTDRSSYTVIGRVEKGAFVCTLRDEYDVARDLLGAAEKANDQWLIGFCKSLIYRLFRAIPLTDGQAKSFTKNCRRYHLTGASTLPATDPKVRGFNWVKGHVEAGNDFPEKVQFWTEGRCCTCGRRLTNPESIEDLEGPVCRRRRGITLTGTVLPLEPEHEDA